MTTTIARTKAKRAALVFKIGAVLALGAAIAIGALGIPGASAEARISAVSERSSEPGTSVPGAPSESGAQRERTDIRSAEIDSMSIAARLALVDNAPAIIETTPNLEEETDDPGAIQEPESTDGALAKRVRYLGYISDPESALAFIRIDGAQRIVRQGATAMSGDDTMRDLEVRRVTPTSIVVSDGEVEDTIRLATRQGASIAMTSGESESIETVPTREADVVLTEEELESISHLPPRQRALQERILKRQKMGKPMRGINPEPRVSYRANLSDRGNAQRREQDDREAYPDD